MNDVILFALLSFLVIRIFGLYTSFNFYLDIKKTNFLGIVIGWCLLTISGIPSLFITERTNEFVYSLILSMNNYFFSLGTLLIYAGFFYYFEFSSKSILKILVILGILVPIGLYLVGFSFLADIVSNILLYFLIVLFTWNIIIHKKEMEKIVGDALRFLYLSFFIGYAYVVLSIFTVMQEGTFNLYRSSNLELIFITYLLGIIYNIAILTIFIKSEYNIIFGIKNQLKDKYSHDLGNIIQVIYGGISVIETNQNLDSVGKNSVDLIVKNSHKAGEIIKEIRDL